MCFLQSWKLRFFFYRLYSRFVHQGWAVLAKAPAFLNVALPDFSVEYIISSFQKGNHVYLEGIVPKAAYVSLVVYDTYGNPTSSIYLSSKFFQIEMGKDLAFPSTRYYAIIFRVYQPIEPYEYPSIYLNHRKIPFICPKKRFENSREITSIIQNALSNGIDWIYRPGQPFFLPVRAQKKGLFINPDATYLVGIPTLSRTLLITGKLPKRAKPLCFVGFMTCNMKTTETDHSIGWTDLPPSYRIFVTDRMKHAYRHGYDPSHKNERVLLWCPSNPLPIVVYREVCIDHSIGIKTLESDCWEDAKENMGEYYPEITFLD